MPNSNRNLAVNQAATDASATMGDGRDLATLAPWINQEHQAAQAAIAEGLLHAKAAGELLIQAKAQCPHGAWGKWVDEHFQGSGRTARAYMQIAKRWPELEARWQRAAVLSYREAVRLLGETSQQQGAKGRPKPLAEWSPERRREVFTAWWDAFASYVLAYDAAGRSVKQIAQLTNMPDRDVELVLYPQTPIHPELEHGNERFRQLQEKAVWFFVESVLAMQCDAATYAAENERLTAGVCTLLEAAGAKHQRRAAGLAPAVVWLYQLITSVRDATSADAIMMRLVLDSRTALGIRSTTEDSFLLWLLEHIQQTKIVLRAVDEGKQIEQLDEDFDK